jgi:hypothetical protein
MKNQFLVLFCIGVLNILLFFGVFKLFQNDKFYSHTLGIVSQNYERTGDWKNFEIKRTTKPFVEIKNENYVTWDAAIFKSISERMYISEKEHYGQVRAAFFPLFPILWKFTHSSPLVISIINYLIFIISIAFLVLFLLNTSLDNKLIAFAIFITFPSAIIYYIPYSESLFLFTMMLATIGIIKKKYWIYFIGCALLAMVRPATVFVLFAIFFAEFLIFLTQKNFRSFIKEATVKSSPFILGYICTIVIQYLYSGSWRALLDAIKYWHPVVSYRHFSDWSVEGFGLSVFAIFFICLPSIAFLLSLFLFKGKSFVSDYLGKLKNYKNEYLFIISVNYFIGIFLFTLIKQGFDFHSFSRYILASPLLYIAVLTLLNFFINRPTKVIGIIYHVLTIAVILFLSMIEYGGDKIQFSFFGLYLFILTGFYLVFKRLIPQSLQISFAFLLVLLNTVWNTYLLNVFFSNGWLFT